MPLNGCFNFFKYNLCKKSCNFLTGCNQKVHTTNSLNELTTKQEDVEIFTVQISSIRFEKRSKPENKNEELGHVPCEEEDNEEDEEDVKIKSQKSPSFIDHWNRLRINYDEIKDQIRIGSGRFGTVYRANWHGLVAVKEVEFDETLTEDSIEIRKFKEEISKLCKTRHSNLILFYGACLDSPKCAIVMSLSRGVSLYKYLHNNDSFQKPNFDWTLDVATQIAQGLGYLHSKDLIHKDLQSKNIFIEGSNAVISDFGLDSMAKLCKRLNKNRKSDQVRVTKECIYYMAPELIRELGKLEFEKKFSFKTDVFAFGTLWYEMFAYEFPHVTLRVDTLIYQIGNGLYKNLPSDIIISNNVRNLLFKCWSFRSENRPDFTSLIETLRAFPKEKKILRSPSHPINIC